MAKSATIQARIEPGLKERVENILYRLGLSATDAINLLYNQIDLNKGLPFEVKVPNKSTQKAIEDVRKRRNLKSAKDTKDLMRQLGV